MLTATLVLLSGIISWLVVYKLIHCASDFGLVQNPNHRSSHTQPTPSGGGLGILIGVTLSGGYLAWNRDPRDLEMFSVLGLSCALGVVGLLDDVSHLSARSRLGIQILVCGLLLFTVSHSPLSTMLPGATHHLGSPVLLLIFTMVLVFAAVWWINLFNFMDGIDGIAGAQAVFMLLAAAFLAASFNPSLLSDSVWVWTLCIASATSGFLGFNWPPAKIFMGDVGSTFLAFIIFAVAFLSITLAWFPPYQGIGAWLILGSVFIVDASVTLIIRIFRRQRWYEAHRSHVYQRLYRRSVRLGSNAAQTTQCAIAINLLWVAPLAWACLAFPKWALCWTIVAYLPLILGAVVIGAGMPDRQESNSSSL